MGTGCRLRWRDQADRHRPGRRLPRRSGPRRGRRDAPRRRHFDVSPLGLGATAAAASLILAISPRAPDLLYEARTFALVIAAVGIVNLALVVKPTPSPAT